LCVVRETDTVEHTHPRLFEGQPSWIGTAAHGGASEARRRVVADASRALGASPDDALTLLARAAVPALAHWCVIRVIESEGRMRRLPTIYADVAHARTARAMDEYYALRTDATAHAPESGVARVLRTGESVVIPEVTLDWLRTVARDATHLGL